MTSQPISRSDRDLIARLASYSAATIHEAQGRAGALDSDIKPIDAAMELCGPAFTVVCAPRDNLMLQVAISYAAPGDVIVVSASDYAEAGSFGDVLANAAQSRGIAGLVTDTGVRDSRDIVALGFPVFSKSVSIKGTVKETIGALNEPVVVGGQLIRPGDLVKGDADGVVVVRRADLAFAVESSEERVRSERDLIARYRSGMTPIEVSNLTEVLAGKGFDSPAATSS
ncbi:4-carboxy-4-hydroxy-2-oxoadipate aldolase/oxaloacetate decarboxylase [Nonomuraea insulae]|uniref:Putative 4-hydroxy-4-methyl-2-oxoglutarate aldolase n=1 Tax=Nonomuraea insulae TaxID=1616787 RepID=A0ABW1D2R8_9ACTN